jgi:flagellar hook-associated protein 2
MSGSSSVDGLVSGLDTTSLINSLMQVEKQPQVLLQQQQTAAQKDVDTFTTLKGKLTAVDTAALALKDTPGWAVTKATSSDESVAIATSSGGSAGSVSFTVSNLAAAHTLISDNFVSATTAVVATGPITVNGVNITDVGDGSMSAVASAINNSNAGVIANAVQVGTNQYKLQLTARTTGAASTFTATGFTPAMGNMGIVSQGTDAELQVGSTNPYTVKSSTNLFKDLVPGLALTVRAKSTAPITVGVAADSDAMATKVQSFVTAINDALSYITQQSTYDTTKKTAGPLLGDLTAGRIKDALINAVSGLVTSDKKTSKSAGITLQRDGTLQFDKAAFLTNYTTDPKGMGALFQQGDPLSTTDDGLAQNVHKAMDLATDFSTGYLTQLISDRKKSVDDLGDQVSAWDTRLQAKQDQLKLQFSNLETALSSLKNQSSWLAGQLSSLQ